MRYFYEYKYKQGALVGGDNLEQISIKDNLIKLSGVDYVPTYEGMTEGYWSSFLNMNEIEYLKITPMGETGDEP